MKKMLIILFCFANLFCSAQTCYPALQKIQKQFYKKNVAKLQSLNTDKFLESVKEMEKVIGRGSSTEKMLRFAMDPKNKKTKYDDLSFRWYLDTAVKFLSNSKTLRESKVLNHVVLGTIPENLVNAELRKDELPCYVIMCNPNLFTFINELTKVAIFSCLTKDDQIELQDTAVTVTDLKARIDLQTRLDSLIRFYTKEQPLPVQKMIKTEGIQWLEIMLVQGSEYYTFAHEYAHAILRHPTQGLLNADAWQQELNADRLAFRIYSEAIISNQNLDMKSKQIMLLAPTFYFSMLTMLENERYYDLQTVGYYPSYREMDIIKYVDQGMKYVKNEQDGFTVKPELDSDAILKNFTYPPAFLRQTLVTLMEIMLDQTNNPYLEYVITFSRNLNLLYGFITDARSPKR